MNIYADNAATTKMSRTAINAMLPYMEEIYGNPSSLHSVGQQAAEALWNARETIASCLGLSPKEIYFTSGGSEADNQAIITAAAIGARKGKKHIISTAFEHHAVLNKADLIDGVAVKGGGYRLNRSPSEYIIGDVLRVTERDMSPVTCFGCKAEACTRTEECRTHPIWEKYQKLTNQYFDGITIADLLIAPPAMK